MYWNNTVFAYLLLLLLTCAFNDFCVFCVLKLSQNKATDIFVNACLLSDLLYESEYEGQMWMLYNSNKMLIGVGDAFSERVSLDYMFNLRLCIILPNFGKVLCLLKITNLDIVFVHFTSIVQCEAWKRRLCHKTPGTRSGDILQLQLSLLIVESCRLIVMTGSSRTQGKTRASYLHGSNSGAKDCIAFILGYTSKSFIGDDLQWEVRYPKVTP